MTDFGKLLDAWERSRTRKKNTFESLLDRYPPGEAEKREPPTPSFTEHPRKWKTNAVLDVHGMTVAEAERALDDFIRHSMERGHRKVLIIHGKGIHSSGKPVLKSAIHAYLDRHPHAGMRGQADKKQGGSGALWFVLKQ